MCPSCWPSPGSLPGTPLSAATLKVRTDAEEIAAAERIVRGRVESVRTERRNGTGVIETVARLRVIDDYAGGADRIIEIRELGGTVAGSTLHIPGAAQFVVGDDVLAMVERKGGAWRPSAMSRSVYGVRETVAGAQLVRQTTGEPTAGERPASLVGWLCRDRSHRASANPRAHVRGRR